MIQRSLVLLLVTIAPCVVVAEELSVFPEVQLTASPDKLLYAFLQRRAHELLSHRQEEYEAVSSPEEVTAYQQRMRQQFLDALGGFPERTPLNARIVGELNGGSYRIQKILFESRPQHHVTAVMYLPQTAPPYPCVIVASGHSRTAKAADYNQRYGIIMARHGMAALCYDPIGQGERSQILADDGNAKHRSTTTEHFHMGVGAILVGVNTATYRVWDGIRAIDYATSRDDILADRIGFTGCSGGGTLTSYVMALDDRVLAAAPSCYLTTFGRLIDTIGPQDAEQNIFAQLAFGMDHPDYVLMRAPRPTLISSTTDDYFDIEGAWSNYRQAKRWYTQLGSPEKVDLVEGPGGHGVPMNNLNATMRWMRRWLLNKDDGRREEALEVHELDALQVTETGQVLALQDEKSVYDLNVQRHEQLMTKRAQFQMESSAETKRNRVHQLAGIRPLDQLPPLTVDRLSSIERPGYSIQKIMLTNENGVPLPALEFRPSQRLSGQKVLYLHGGGKQTAAESGGAIERLVQQGALVWAVDLPGLGETRPNGAGGSMGAWKEFYLAYLCGQSLVGLRAEAILQSAAVFERENRSSVVLIATGEAAVPALHAAAVSDHFANVHLPEGIPSWIELLDDPETENQLVNTVHNALRYYTLRDLADWHGKVTPNLPDG